MRAERACDRREPAKLEGTVKGWRSKSDTDRE
jgi:hypothetical protein